jgi:hypothetical protein
MARELTKAEYLRVVHEPRRRFQELSLRDSRVALRGRIAAPCYWFEQDDVGEEDGKYWRVPPQATVSLVVDGKPSLLLYLAGRRLATCTFAYHLSPVELAKAVAAMRRAGLQRLIVPAAQWAIREMPDTRRSVLGAALHRLVRHSRARSPERARRRTRGCS